MYSKEGLKLFGGDILHEIQAANFIIVKSGWLNDQKRPNSQY